MRGRQRDRHRGVECNGRVRARDAERQMLRDSRLEPTHSSVSRVTVS